MSVIVKGMEMPKNCVECPCCRHDNWNGETAHQCNVSFITFGAEDENWIYNTRPNWCPLTELPPHGRLGDLDKLMTEFMDSDLDHLQRDDWKEVIQIVADASTVIEAEGSET